ncbi:MAG: autotransporter outer membrane beta-barrel domain-containing protein [Sedimentisphaerales bacterium]
MKKRKEYSWYRNFTLKAVIIACILVLISCFLSSAWAETTPGGFLVNGQKTFPMGWYALNKWPELGIPGLAGITPLNESMQYGFNFVMPYYARAEGIANITAYMNTACARGVKFMLDLHPSSMIDEVTSWVNLVKNHPGLYGYYLDDEPEIRGIPASTLIAKYNAIKAADPNPNHIVLLVLYSAVSTHTDYLAACDVIGRELYTTNLYSSVPADVAAAKAAGKGYLALPGLYQAFGHSLPTPTQFRYMVFAPVSMGADGIMPFIFEGVESTYGAPATGFRNSIVYPATNQLKTIIPVILKGRVGLSSSCNNTYSGNITWVFAGDGDEAVLVAVNNNQTLSRSGVGFTLSGLNPSITTATVLGESRTVTLTSGSFTDNFAAMGVHIYFLKSSNAVQPSTITALVETDSFVTTRNELDLTSTGYVSGHTCLGLTARSMDGNPDNGDIVIGYGDGRASVSKYDSLDTMISCATVGDGTAVVDAAIRPNGELYFSSSSGMVYARNHLAVNAAPPGYMVPVDFQFSGTSERVYVATNPLDELIAVAHPGIVYLRQGNYMAGAPSGYLGDGTNIGTTITSLLGLSTGDIALGTINGRVYVRDNMNLAAAPAGFVGDGTVIGESGAQITVLTRTHGDLLLIGNVSGEVFLRNVNNLAAEPRPGKSYAAFQSMVLSLAVTANNNVVIGLYNGNVYVRSLLDIAGSDITMPVDLGGPVIGLETNPEPMPNCIELIARGQGLVGDLNNDCYVNFSDLAEFAMNWTKCNAPENDNCD